MQIKVTCVVKSTVVFQQNHLTMEVHNLLSDFYYLIIAIIGLCHSILQILQTNLQRTVSYATLQLKRSLDI